jgi:hypothetical protein
MALDIEAFNGLQMPTPADRFAPRVLPRRKPSMAALSGFTPLTMPAGASSSPQGRPNAVYANPAPATMAMPSMLPISKPAKPSPTPYSQMGAPDFVTAMPKANLVTPTTPSAPSGGLLGNLLADDINSAKGQGIMAAAQSLLESGGPVKGNVAPSLGQALGRAMGAYNIGAQGFDDRELARKDADINNRYKQAQAAQMEAAANRPILQDLGNGAFTRVIDPVTGESKIIENSDVKNYLEAQAVRKQTKNVNLTDKQIEAQTDDLDNITATNDLLADTDGFLDLIDGGMLEFGLADSIGDATMAYNPFMSEQADQEARNSEAFTRYISRLRNELLRMAKGVQTDGDAERAITEIITATESKNTEAVKQALEDLRKVQQRTIKRYREKVQNRRKAKGLSEYEFGNEASADGVSYSVVEGDD